MGPKLSVIALDRLECDKEAGAADTTDALFKTSQTILHLLSARSSLEADSEFTAVDDVHIGSADYEESDNERFSNDVRKNSADIVLPYEVHDRGVAKDRNKLHLGAGYEGNITPRRTRGPKIGGAYLNADLDKPEYMRISKELVEMLIGTGHAFPADQIQEDGSVVVKLLKALYGLKQAGRAWYDLLTKELESHGYVRSDIDRCLFTKISGESITHIAIYVDDLLIVGNDEFERLNVLEKTTIRLYRNKSTGRGLYQFRRPRNTYKSR